MAFLSWLATKRHVSASTQNQALSALLFLYRRILQIEIGPLNPVARAKRPTRAPVVLTEGEVARLLENLHDVVWIAVALLYGSGLRLQEGLDLRVKDLDFARDEIVVRRGKGEKDRRTMLPAALEPRLQAHLEQVRAQARAERRGRLRPGGAAVRVGPEVSEGRHGVELADRLPGGADLS